MPTHFLARIITNMNLKELLKLAGEQGKVVIVGDDGDVKGLLLTYAEYQKNHPQQDSTDARPDPEKINREILEAQLKDNIAPSNHNLETVAAEVTMPESIGQILQERAQNLFVSKPAPPTLNEINYDPREESEHPALQRTASSTISLTDDEEIKPNFEDI